MASDYEKYGMKLPLDATFEQAVIEAFRVSKTSFEFEHRLLYFQQEKKAAKEIKFLLFELQKIGVTKLFNEALFDLEKAEDVADTKSLLRLFNELPTA